MNSIAAWLLISLTVCLLCSSCLKEKTTTPVSAESEVLAMAKREFRKAGRKVEDYRITVDHPTNDVWWVRFDLDVRYPPPGASHYVRVEKQTGRVVFMPGE